MDGVIGVLWVSALSFAVLFVLAKLLGKKQIAQLDFVDYVIGISIGSIAAEMTFDDSTPFYYFIIAMAVFFLLDIAINYIGRKGPFMKRLFKGKPLVLMYNGKLNFENLKKSGLDMNDFLSLCRQSGYFDVEQIEYAVFETDGNLSIMPTGEERPTVTKDLPVAVTPPSLPNYLVTDGAVSYSGLAEIDKDERWLLDKLGFNGKDALKTVILASYDPAADSVKVHFKN
ncbi:MAG: DUF421 domain-containing protein [Clostridiales bacterium]|jgi:uncharacterized membrane protein YcaP (DUF421 family)|nr:DUF421 domain-containing protein [Clostridiales bacterium]